MKHVASKLIAATVLRRIQKDDLMKGWSHERFTPHEARSTMPWIGSPRKESSTPPYCEDGGVEAKGEKLSIPYYDSESTELYRKVRNNPKASSRFWYDPTGCTVRPYGLWRLGEFRKGVLYIAEGETDTWAFWSARLVVLGIPGSTNAECLELEHLIGIETLYLCQDDDAGGGRSSRSCGDASPQSVTRARRSI